MSYLFVRYVMSNAMTSPRYLKVALLLLIQINAKKKMALYLIFLEVF